MRTVKESLAAIAVQYTWKPTSFRSWDDTGLSDEIRTKIFIQIPWVVQTMTRTPTHSLHTQVSAQS